MTTREFQRRRLLCTRVGAVPNLVDMSGCPMYCGTCWRRWMRSGESTGAATKRRTRAGDTRPSSGSATNCRFPPPRRSAESLFQVTRKVNCTAQQPDQLTLPGELSPSSCIRQAENSGRHCQREPTWLAWRPAWLPSVPAWRPASPASRPAWLPSLPPWRQPWPASRPASRLAWLPSCSAWPR